MLNNIIEEINRRVDIVEYAQRFPEIDFDTFTLNRPNPRSDSFEDPHGTKKNAVSWNFKGTNLAKDFRTGRIWTPLKLCQALVFGDMECTPNSLPLAIEEMKKVAHIDSIPLDKSYFNELKNIKSNVADWQNSLYFEQNKPALDYVKSRGIHEQLLKKRNIGYKSYYSKGEPIIGITIPHYDMSDSEHENPISYTVRYFDVNPKEKDNQNIPNPYYTNFQRDANNNYSIIYKEGKPLTKASYWNKPGEIPLHGLDTLYTGVYGLKPGEYTDTVVWTEGLFDALAFMQEKPEWGTLCNLTCNFNSEHFNQFCNLIPNKSNKKILIAYDNDKKGITGALKLAQNFFDNGYFNVYICNPAGFFGDEINKDTGVVFNDVNERFVAEGTINGIIDSEAHALCYMVYHTMDIKAMKIDVIALKKALQKIVRIIDLDYLDQILAEVYDFYLKVLEHFYTRIEQKQFNAQVERTEKLLTKDLPKQFRKSPNETLIRDEILESHDLIYSDFFDFYEFTGKVWETKEKSEIGGYIDDTLGTFATGQKCYSILRLIKDQAVKRGAHVEFNHANTMVFQNGTYNFDSDKFNENSFNERDFSTIMLDYEYNPEATCPTFMRFIGEALGGNTNLIRMIQEFMGYVLFPKNNLDKVMFLVGEKGSNGKSTFLKVLENVFGADNCKHLTLNDLGRPFQVASLEHGLLNIVGEQQKDAYGTQDILKTLGSIDSISAEKKGKDPRTIYPRCKHIYACNDLPKMGRIDKGMERRLLIIPFDQVFVSNPKLPNEHPIDVNLGDKLAEECPGIFNWALAGYHRLQNNGGEFTHSVKSDEAKENYMNDSDPILQFYNENYLRFLSYAKAQEQDVSEGKSTQIVLTNDYLFDEFTNWAIRYNYQPMSSFTFHKRFGNLWKEKRAKAGEIWEKKTVWIGMVNGSKKGLVLVSGTIQDPELLVPEDYKEQIIHIKNQYKSYH